MLVVLTLGYIDIFEYLWCFDTCVWLQSVDEDGRTPDGGGDRRGSISPSGNSFVVPLGREGSMASTSTDTKGQGQLDGVAEEVAGGEDELELDSFISGIGLNK